MRSAAAAGSTGEAAASAGTFSAGMSRTAAATARTTARARTTTATRSALCCIHSALLASVIAHGKIPLEFARRNAVLPPTRGSRVVPCLWVVTADGSQRRMSLTVGWFHGPAGYQMRSEIVQPHLFLDGTLRKCAPVVPRRERD